MHPGMVGAIVGSLMGVAGGVAGTWLSIRNTHGPRERAFMIRANICAWVTGGLFLVLLILLPNPWRWLLWVPYSILLPLGIIFGNKRLQRIQQEESQPDQANGEIESE